MTDPTHRLTVQIDGGAQTFDIGPDPAVVGRSKENTVALNHGSISRRHCEIRFTAEGIEVRDLSSSNGTFVNGNQIVRSKVSPGDSLRFGQLDAELAVAAAAGAAPAAPASDPVGAGEELALDEISLDDPVAPAAEPVLPAADDLELDEISLDDDPAPAAPAPKASPAKAHGSKPKGKAPTGPASDYTLVVADGDMKGERFPLAKQRLIIGRSGGCDLVLKGLGVSGKHAEIVWDGDRPTLRDLASTNGVLVDGKRVDEVALRNNLRISIGKVAVDVNGPVDEISLDGDLDVGADLQLDDDQPAVHQITDRDVPKGSKLGLIVIPLLVIGLGAAAFFYFKPPAKGLTGIGKREVVTVPSDSLLKYGFSAEEADADARWAVQNVAGAELERSAAAKKSGRWGIAVTRKEKKVLDGPTIALYAEKMPVDARRGYRVDASARVAEGESAASVMVRFLNADDVVLEERLAPITTDTSFTALEIQATAPQGALAAQVGLVALLGNGVTHFDDITLRPSDSAATPIEHQSNRYALEFSPEGVFTFRSDGDWPVQRMEYFVGNKGRRYPQTYYFRPGGDQVVQSGEKTTCSGVLRGPASEGPLTLTVSGKDTVAITYSGWAGKGIDNDGVRFRVTEKDLKAGLLVSVGGAVSPQTGPFAIEQADALVVGGGPRPLRFRFPTPLDVDVRRAPDGVLVELKRKSDGTAKPLQIEVKTSLVELLASAKTALERGREAILDERYGDAFRQLYKVLSDYAVNREDIETAQSQLEKVREKFRAEFEAVKRRAEQAAYFSDLREIEAVERDAAALQEAYRDTPVASQTKDISDKLAAAAKEKRETQMKAFAEKHLTIARDFSERGATHFAEKFYGTVIDRCKGTQWAADAAKELDELKKVVTDLEKKG